MHDDAGGGAAPLDDMILDSRPGAAPAPSPADDLDAWIARDVRLRIEARYLAPITALGRFEEILRDDAFLADPVGHPALFADHGVTHARDVAHQVLQVLDTVTGRLIPARTPDRLQWMKAYGVLLAFVHDIGMIDPSPAGRAVHPEVAAREVMGPGFDAIMDGLWTSDPVGLARRVCAAFPDEASARAAFREMIAMALGHSKRKVPVDLLNDPARLQALMREAVGDAASFGWLIAPDPALRALAGDVIDTLRALRAADALRMRGTVLKTSGQYEVFVDQRTANAVFAFRSGQRQLHLLEVHDPVAVGEANLSRCEFDGNLDLRFAFHHGRFGSEEATARAAACAARVVHDIAVDAITSFARAAPANGLIPSASLHILIEAPDDNPAFAGMVVRELADRDLDVAALARIVPSIALATSSERVRYRLAREVDWDLARRREVLAQIGLSGHPVDRIDPDAAFAHVRIVHLRAGETLIEAGAPAGFVYVPMADFLRGRPLGDYADFTLGSFTLVGLTGVVRGAARNADVFAGADLSLLAIPKAVFLDHWYFTYSPETLAMALTPVQATQR
jgi:hypothetical protein